uniref:Uncharacterized protein n=1 Tax=Glossina austeni TaxID=7395 RepID=A0A1A9VT92_GLOAU
MGSGKVKRPSLTIAVAPGIGTVDITDVRMVVPAAEADGGGDDDPNMVEPCSGGDGNGGGAAKAILGECWHPFVVKAVTLFVVVKMTLFELLCGFTVKSTPLRLNASAEAGTLKRIFAQSVSKSFESLLVSVVIEGIVENGTDSFKKIRDDEFIRKFMKSKVKAVVLGHQNLGLREYFGDPLFDVWAVTPISGHYVDMKALQRRKEDIDKENFNNKFKHLHNCTSLTSHGGCLTILFDDEVNEDIGAVIDDDSVIVVADLLLLPLLAAVLAVGDHHFVSDDIAA